MIKELNRACKSVNTALGISIRLPEPKKNTLKSASALNLLLGVGLMVAGVIFTQKWCTIAGGISIINGLVLKRETKTE